MTDQIGYILIVLICNTAIGVFLYLSWRERRELYSRLQSGTLTDFAVNKHRMEVTPPKKISAPPMKGPELPGVHEAERVFVELPASVTSEAQAAARDLMGGE